jgi:cysteinyl-tRNA synthetase, unknown class
MTIFRFIFYFNVVLFLLSVNSGCKKNNPLPPNIDYRQEMRNFVTDLADYSRNFNSNFLIIPQNGQELITSTGEATGTLQTTYINKIDATGRESMFYGYYKDNKETPAKDKQHLLDLCILCEQQGIEVLTTDYCSTPAKMDNSYQLNSQYGFVSFAANHRELDNVPVYPAKPFNENNNNILDISQVKNFLYMINGADFNTKQAFIDKVSATNYDLIIMDLFQNGTAFSTSEITQLKTKQNGGKRLVVCYLSIGEAEDYRYYWNTGWKKNPPTWLEPENKQWKGNYKVRYWDSDWQKIIYGNDGSYMKKIIDAGFDGAYLDIIDGFEYFEEK